MSEPGPRVAAWLGTVVDLLGEYLDHMPESVLFDQLSETFSITGAGHSILNADGTQSMVTAPDDLLSSADELDAWLGGEYRDDHPLHRWYAVTQDPRPYTIGRVSTAIAPLRSRARIEPSLRRLELDEQLCVPYRTSGHSQRAFVLGRTSTDFSDDDLTVAHYVQQALVGIDRHIAVLQRHCQRSEAAAEVGLTGREMTVLGLISAGYTTRTVARRLGCSPRTVDKHLERIFRKLGVRDKLNAVRVAGLWGLTPPSPNRPTRRAALPVTASEQQETDEDQPVAEQ